MKDVEEDVNDLKPLRMRRRKRRRRTIIDDLDEFEQSKGLFRPEKSFCRPIMLMYAGQARCINNYFPDLSFVAKRLATGSILGESDATQSIGIDFFGDIYAEKNGLECLVIEKPDLCLDEYEKRVL